MIQLTKLCDKSVIIYLVYLLPSPSGTENYYGVIKTHGPVSAAKKAMWHTSVLFTETTNSPFSTPHISTTRVNFYEIHMFYTLHIHDPTYQI